METRNLFLGLRTYLRSSPRPSLTSRPRSSFRRFTSCPHRLADSPSRPSASAPPRSSSNPSRPATATATATTATTTSSNTYNALGALSRQFKQQIPPALRSSSSNPATSGRKPTIPGIGSSTGNAALAEQSLAEYAEQHDTEREHHLHIYTHKHNTHLTLSNTARNSLISISAGNLGFRKSQRGSYDAAFQLAAYLLTRMQQQGIVQQIEHLELVFRGFGPGREAVTKVIMGMEGARLRDKICRVVDKTRLKIGGTRSPRPRRLG